jgi:hypothetical protein
MRLSSTSTSCRFRPRSLDALNFLLADVRGALGSWLDGWGAIQLLTMPGTAPSS